ncbi:MerR family transcriptional regulator [Streptomyces bobili]|uniref:helix-turn-helix transcriptional regulator n=1 Tax=Streptomyces bobili TaxID=67280 RepID=UPI0034372CB8
MHESTQNEHEQNDTDDRLNQLLATAHAELLEAIATQQRHAPPTMTVIRNSGASQEPTKTTAQELWSYKEIAAHLKVQPETVRSYRKHGLLPAPDHVEGGKPYWSPNTVRVWIASRPGHREA